MPKKPAKAAPVDREHQLRAELEKWHGKPLVPGSPDAKSHEVLVGEYNAIGKDAINPPEDIDTPAKMIRQVDLWFTRLRMLEAAGTSASAVSSMIKEAHELGRALSLSGKPIEPTTVDTVAAARTSLDALRNWLLKFHDGAGDKGRTGGKPPQIPQAPLSDPLSPPIPLTIIAKIMGMTRRTAHKKLLYCGLRSVTERSWTLDLAKVPAKERAELKKEAEKRRAK